MPNGIARKGHIKYPAWRLPQLVPDRFRPLITNNKKIVSGVLIAALLLALAALVPVREVAVDLIGEIRSYGGVAPLVYFFVFLLAAVAGISRTVLTIVAGVIFEPVTAFLLVLVSSVAAFITTFLLARRTLFGWVTRRLDKLPAAGKYRTLVEVHGFRMLVLMRMNPFIPGVVNGYGFGMTSINFRAYLLASVLGSLPLTIIYIYLGWSGGKAILLGASGAGSMETGMLLFGFIVSVITLALFGWYGRRVVNRSSV